MGEEKKLKSGWQWVKFGDVVRLSKERSKDPEADGIERYVGLEHIDPDDLKIRRWGLVSEGITFTSLFKPGQVLFGKRRSYLKKVAVADFEGVCSGDIYVFESANPERLLPILLPFICQTDRFFAHAVGTSAGSLSPRTNWTKLQDYEFALPPIEEQRKLSSVCSKAQLFQDKIENLQDSSYKLQQSILDYFLNSNSKSSIKYLQFRVQKHWNLLTLPELVVQEKDSLTAGPFGTIFKAKDFRDEGVPIVQIRHIHESGFLQEPNMTYMDVNIYKRLHTSYTVYPGELLITKMGEPPGVACLYPENMIPGMVTPDVIKASLDINIVIPKFLVFILNHYRAKSNILRLCKGGTRTRVSLDEFYKLKWPIPPLIEQERILNILDSISSVSSHCMKSSELANKVKDKIMSFTE